MFAMKRTIPRALGRLLAAACLLLAARTASFALSPWSGDLHQPSLYIIEGYLDRAPHDVDIRDQIDITHMVGGTPYWSRAMGRPAKPGSIATFRG